MFDAKVACRQLGLGYAHQPMRVRAIRNSVQIIPLYACWDERYIGGTIRKFCH